MGNFFIRRPIVAMVISIVMVIVGTVALTGLPIAKFPEIVPPMVQVTTTYTGASALDVEQSVATPLEQKINGVERSIYMKSTNANDGTLKIEVSFELGTNLDIASVLVQNRVSEGSSVLPQEVKQYGVVTKKSLAFPMMLVTLTSPSGAYDNVFLSNYANINIVDQLARLPGVGQTLLFGGSDYSMRIWVRPDKLRNLGLTVSDLTTAIQQQNVLQPAGQLGGPPAPPGVQFTYAVKTKGRLLNAEEFGEIIVRANPDGSIVRLRDVARIELGSLLYNSVGRLNGKGAAVIGIYQLPGSNALELSKKVRSTMEELGKRFPAGIEHRITLDTTAAVTAGIEEIISTLFEAVLLVILVVFVFLQNWRATLIPLLTVPVSLIGTFIVFPLLGFSVNTLSLLGLVLAIGIVVDDAIVVVEAVMHHLEQGKSPREATEQAMKEVSGPVVAIALVLTAVFVPVAFMPGLTGRLYQQFAVTIAISVCFSAVNALTLSPALASLLLKAPTGKRSLLTPFYDVFNKYFGKLTDGYVGFTGILVRKAYRSMVLVLITARAGGGLRRAGPRRLPPRRGRGVLLRQRPAPRRLLAGADRGHRQEGPGDHPGPAPASSTSPASPASPCSPAPTPPTPPSSSCRSSPGRSARPGRSRRPPSSRPSTGSCARRSPRPSPSPSRRRPSPASAPAPASPSCSRTSPARPRRRWPTRCRSSWPAPGRAPRSGPSTPSTGPPCRRCWPTSTATRRSSWACRSPR